MTASQRRAMIDFHAKAARAYRACGDIANAEAAERRADLLREEQAEIYADVMIRRDILRRYTGE